MDTSANDIGSGFAFSVHVVGLTVFLIGGIGVCDSPVRITLRSCALVGSFWISSLCMIVGEVLITYIGARVLIPDNRSR